MIKQKRMLLSIPLLMVALLMGCKNEMVEPSGRLASATDCKTFQYITMQSDLYSLQANYTSTDDCIEYFYNAQNETLIMKHINAGFNCCPGILAAEIIIEGNTILIRESEEKAECLCSCLFDLDFEVMDLKPGIYQVKVIEPYVLADEEQMEFSLNLENSCEGKHCVQRTFNPWGSTK